MGIAWASLLRKIHLSALRLMRDWSNDHLGMASCTWTSCVDRMRREFNVEANIGKPQVSYRERIHEELRNRRQVRSPVRRSWPVRSLLDSFCYADEGQEGRQFVNEVVWWCGS